MRSTGRLPGPLQAAARTGSALAVALTVHSLLNLRLLRRPAAQPPACRQSVSVLIPARNEAERIGPCLDSVLAQRNLPHLEVLVLDDGSLDGTCDVVAARQDPRLQLLPGAALPAGWLGKPHACQQLADAASGQLLVFLDADVRLAPDAIASAAQLMQRSGLDLASPYPRQECGTIAERLVQPLLQWSWATTLPLRLAERSTRPSLAAANGQFLLVGAAAYRRCGQHRAIRTEVLDDLALVRAVKATGGRGGVVDGTHLARCRMYTGWSQVREGYTKSLWSAFGPAPAAASTISVLLLAYVVPPVAALLGSRSGLVGYLAAVLGRLAVAHRVHGQRWPDSLAHPVSILLLAWLTATSHVHHRRGRLTWRGRTLPGA